MAKEAADAIPGDGGAGADRTNRGRPRVTTD
jgi:hypothetical protein